MTDTCKTKCSNNETCTAGASTLTENKTPCPTLCPDGSCSVDDNSCCQESTDVSNEKSEEVHGEESSPPVAEVSHEAKDEVSHEAKDEVSHEAKDEVSHEESDDEDLEFGMEEIYFIKNLVEKCAERGVFKTQEYKSIGNFMEKVEKIVDLCEKEEALESSRQESEHEPEVVLD